MFRLSTTSPTKLSLSGGLGRIGATRHRQLVVCTSSSLDDSASADWTPRLWQTGLEQQQRALGSGLHHEIVVKAMSAASPLLLWLLAARKTGHFMGTPCRATTNGCRYNMVSASLTRALGRVAQ